MFSIFMLNKHLRIRANRFSGRFSTGTTRKHNLLIQMESRLADAQALSEERLITAQKELKAELSLSQKELKADLRFWHLALEERLTTAQKELKADLSLSQRELKADLSAAQVALEERLTTAQRLLRSQLGDDMRAYFNSHAFAFVFLMMGTFVGSLEIFKHFGGGLVVTMENQKVARIQSKPANESPEQLTASESIEKK